VRFFIFGDPRPLCILRRRPHWSERFENRLRDIPDFVGKWRW
jgi:hypothetical protein